MVPQQNEFTRELESTGGIVLTQLFAEGETNIVE